MNTAPKRTPRVARTSGPRRPASAARRSSPAPLSQEDFAGDDGRLRMVSESGAEIHVSPANVTETPALHARSPPDRRWSAICPTGWGSPRP